MVEASSSTIFVTKQSSTSHMESTSPATPSKTASPGNSTSATMGKEEKVSCVKYFDALWFCYCTYCICSVLNCMTWNREFDSCLFLLVLFALFYSLCSLVFSLQSCILSALSYSVCSFVLSTIFILFGFIYAAPAHQLKRYYVYGDVDDCLGHWNTLFACLKQKTKFKEEETPLLSNPNTLWDIRTCDEAKSFWKQEFSDNETERPKVFTDAKSAGV